MINCRIISGIFSVERRNKSLLFEGAEFCLAYTITNEVREKYLLVFNGVDPGDSKPSANFVDAKRDLKIIGGPLPYSKFKDFFKLYSTQYDKRFYYVDPYNKEIDYYEKI